MNNHNVWVNCIEQMAKQWRRRKQRKLNCSPSITLNGKEARKQKLTHLNKSHASTTGWVVLGLISNENTMLSVIVIYHIKNITIIHVS